MGWWTFNLLSVQGVHDGEEQEQLSICINPLSARAILGKGGYTLVHRCERSKLKKEEARALHSVLSGLVDMGSKRVLGADMLADKVYSRYQEEINAATVRRRRKSIVDACTDINGLSYWSCSIVGKGIHTALEVARKRRKDLPI
jgi:hypothetical protein